MTIPQSKKIDAKKAKAEIQERKGLHQPLAKYIDALAAFVSKPRTDVDNYYNNQGNAFLFTRDSVLRHFFRDPQNLDRALFNDNTHLLTILAAHDMDEDGFKKGHPTVIIAGTLPSKDPINTDAQGKEIYKYEFKTDNNYPADEFPPIETIDDLDPTTNPPTVINSILLRF